MHYETFHPGPALAPYVRGLYYFAGDAGDPDKPHIFRFPSDGGPELILNLGDPFAAGSCEARLQTFSGFNIIGPLSCHLLTHTAGSAAFVAVRFRPGGMAPFFDVPAYELTDQIADIETFWGAFGKQTEQQARKARTPEETVTIVQRALCARQSYPFSIDRPMTGAIDDVFASRGQLRVGHLARAAGLSRRQFERRFKRMVGLSPKRLCRIVRFANAFDPTHRNHQKGWVQTALACGYSDQAHLIRECRYFTGHSPEAYLRKRSPLEDAIFNGA